VECEEDPSNGQLAIAKAFECYVDMKNPITMPKDTDQNVQKWSSESSRYREILNVLDADAVNINLYFNSLIWTLQP
jgi:hypothetical protein